MEVGARKLPLSHPVKLPRRLTGTTSNSHNRPVAVVAGSEFEVSIEPVAVVGDVRRDWGESA